MAEQRLQFVEETSLYNHIVLGRLLPSAWWEHLPHFLQTWLRNYIGGNWRYFIPNFLWCFYIYYWKRNIFVPRDAIRGRKAMLLQIYVSMKAMPWYCLLPTVSENMIEKGLTKCYLMIEKGLTKCYLSISDVGLPLYLVQVIVYLVLVEFGIYWVHRALHDIKSLYRYLHATHHMYNKQNVLSPFAGMALQPLDGVLQALPHAIAPFIVPIHFRSHIALMFLEAMWTANIHDCIHAKIWPIMGAGYHTIHHATNRHNYGHYTILMDWMLGTLRDPIDDSYEKEM